MMRYRIFQSRLLGTIKSALVLGCLLGIFGSLPASAQQDAVQKVGVSTGLPIPRFVSLGVTKGNLRVGPKQTHPIAWVYQRKGLPLEIIQEHESWRKTRDIDGDIGWMHKRLLVGRRAAVITADWASIRVEPDDISPLVIRAEKGVVAAVEECATHWCLVAIKDQEGWVDKSSIWGIYPDEVFD